MLDLGAHYTDSFPGHPHDVTGPCLPFYCNRSLYHSIISVRWVGYSLAKCELVRCCIRFGTCSTSVPHCRLYTGTHLVLSYHSSLVAIFRLSQPLR